MEYYAEFYGYSGRPTGRIVDETEIEFIRDARFLGDFDSPREADIEFDRIIFWDDAGFLQFR